MAEEDIKISAEVDDAARAAISAVSADIKSLIYSIDRQTNASKESFRAQTALNRAFGFGADGSRVYAKTLSDVARNSATIVSYNQQVARTLKQVSSGYTTATKAADMYGKDTVQNLAKVAKSANAIRFTQAIQDAQSLSRVVLNLGKNMQYVGRNLTIGLTLPIISLFRAGLDSYKRLENEIIRFEKIASDAFTGLNTIEGTTEQYERFKKELDDITEKYGVARELVQAVAADFATVGIPESSISSLVKLSAEVEKLGDVTMEESRQFVQSLLFQSLTVQRAKNGFVDYGLAIDQVSGQLATFNAIENNTVVTLKMVAKAIPEMQAVTTQFGLTLTEATAAFAPMIAAGFEVGASGNSIKVSLQRLVAPAKQNREILKELADIIGGFNFEVGVGIESVSELARSFVALEKAKGAQGALELFARLFGVRQGSRMLQAFKELSYFQEELSDSTSGSFKVINTIVDNVNKSVAAAGLAQRYQATSIDELSKISRDAADAYASGNTVLLDAIESGQNAAVDILEEGGKKLTDEIDSQAGRILALQAAGRGKSSEIYGQELARALESPVVKLARARETFKKISRTLIPPLVNALEAMMPTIKRLADFISGLSSRTISLVVSLLAAAAAVGPLITVFSNLLQSAGFVAGAVVRLSKAFTLLTGQSGVFLSAEAFAGMRNLDAFGDRLSRLNETTFFFRGNMKKLNKAFQEASATSGRVFGFDEEDILKKRRRGRILPTQSKLGPIEGFIRSLIPGLNALNQVEDQVAETVGEVTDKIETQSKKSTRKKKVTADLSKVVDKLKKDEENLKKPSEKAAEAIDKVGKKARKSKKEISDMSKAVKNANNSLAAMPYLPVGYKERALAAAATQGAVAASSAASVSAAPQSQLAKNMANSIRKARYGIDVAEEVKKSPLSAAKRLKLSNVMQTTDEAFIKAIMKRYGGQPFNSAIMRAMYIKAGRTDFTRQISIVANRLGEVMTVPKTGGASLTKIFEAVRGDDAGRKLFGMDEFGAISAKGAEDLPKSLRTSSGTQKSQPSMVGRKILQAFSRSMGVDELTGKRRKQLVDSFTVQDLERRRKDFVNKINKRPRLKGFTVLSGLKYEIQQEEEKLNKLMQSDKAVRERMQVGKKKIAKALIGDGLLEPKEVEKITKLRDISGKRGAQIMLSSIEKDFEADEAIQELKEKEKFFTRRMRRGSVSSSTILSSRNAFDNEAKDLIKSRKAAAKSVSDSLKKGGALSVTSENKDILKDFLIRAGLEEIDVTDEIAKIQKESDEAMRVAKREIANVRKNKDLPDALKKSLIAQRTARIKEDIPRQTAEAISNAKRLKQESLIKLIEKGGDIDLDDEVLRLLQKGGVDSVAEVGSTSYYQKEITRVQQDIEKRKDQIVKEADQRDTRRLKQKQRRAQRQIEEIRKRGRARAERVMGLYERASITLSEAEELEGLSLMGAQSAEARGELERRTPFRRGRGVSRTAPGGRASRTGRLQERIKRAKNNSSLLYRLIESGTMDRSEEEQVRERLESLVADFQARYEGQELSALDAKEADKLQKQINRDKKKLDIAKRKTEKINKGSSLEREKAARRRRLPLLGFKDVADVNLEQFKDEMAVLAGTTSNFDDAAQNAISGLEKNAQLSKTKTGRTLKGRAVSALTSLFSGQVKGTATEVQQAAQNAVTRATMGGTVMSAKPARLIDGLVQKMGITSITPTALLKRIEQDLVDRGKDASAALRFFGKPLTDDLIAALDEVFVQGPEEAIRSVADMPIRQQRMGYANIVPDGDQKSRMTDPAMQVRRGIAGLIAEVERLEDDIVETVTETKESIMDQSVKAKGTGRISAAKAEAMSKELVDEVLDLHSEIVQQLAAESAVVDSVGEVVEGAVAPVAVAGEKVKTEIVTSTAKVVDGIDLFGDLYDELGTTARTVEEAIEIAVEKAKADLVASGTALNMSVDELSSHLREVANDARASFDAASVVTEKAKIEAVTSAVVIGAAVDELGDDLRELGFIAGAMLGGVSEKVDSAKKAAAAGSAAAVVGGGGFGPPTGPRVPIGQLPPPSPDDFGVSTKIGGFRKLFNGIGDAAKATGSKVKGVIGGILGGFLQLNKLLLGFGALLFKIFIGFTFIFGPIIAGIVAIGIAIKQVFTATKGSERLREDFAKAFDAIKRLVKAVIKPFADVINSFFGINTTVSSATTSFNTLGAVLVAVTRKATDFINTLLKSDGFRSFQNSVRTGFTQILNIIINLAAIIKNLFEGDLDAAASWAEQLFYRIGYTFVSIVIEMKDAIKAFTNFFVDVNAIAAKVFVRIMASAFSLAVDLAGKAIKSIAIGFADMWENILDPDRAIGFVAGLVNPLAKSVDALVNGAFNVDVFRDKGFNAWMMKTFHGVEVGAEYAGDSIANELSAGFQDAIDVIRNSPFRDELESLGVPDYALPELNVEDYTSGFDIFDDLINDVAEGAKEMLTGEGKVIDFLIDELKDIQTSLADSFQEKFGTDITAPIKIVSEDVKNSIRETVEEIRSGIAQALEQGGEELTDDMADAVGDAVESAMQKFVDLVVDYLASQIDRIKSEFAEALKEQKEAALSVFDDQIAAIDALAEAEERLFQKQKKIEEERQRLRDRALEQENYRRNRTLAIYEGRIDDARQLDLENRRASEDFANETESIKRDTLRSEQKRQRDIAKEILKRQRDDASKIFDEIIENFEDFVKNIGKYGTLNQEQLEEQFAEIRDAALDHSQDLADAFESYYTELPGLIARYTDPTVGFFMNPLNQLYDEAIDLFGITSNSDSPSTILGATATLLSTMNNRFDSGVRDVSDTFEKGFDDVLELIIKPSMQAISDIIDVFDPGAILQEAFDHANAVMLAEYQKMIDSSVSLTATLVEGMDPIIQKLAAVEAAANSASDAMSDLGGSAGDLEVEVPTWSGYLGRARQDAEDAMAAIEAARKAAEYAANLRPPTDAAYAGLYRGYGGSIPSYGMGGKIKKYANGGYPVPGFGSTPVPAILHGGEFVINSKAVSNIGMAALVGLNNLKFKNMRMPSSTPTSVVNNTSTTNIYVDNFIGQDEWFNSMMKEYNVKVHRRNQKSAGLESRNISTYTGLNRGM